MKKYVSVQKPSRSGLTFFLIMITLLIVSCSRDVSKSKDNIGLIEEAKLTANERNLLTALTGNHFVFNFSLSGKDAYIVDSQLEYFQDGELMGEVYSLRTRGVSGEGSIVLAVSSTPETGDNWVISVIQDSGVASLRAMLPRLVLEGGAVWAMCSRIEIREGEPAILVVMASSKGSSDIPFGVFYGDEPALQELLGNQHVYIFSAVFTKETAANP